MDNSQQNNVYEAENADKIVSDLFKGKLSIEQALQRLRTRLLDLSSRNRLLNYRHPKRRSIQFYDEPNLNLVFDRLIDGKPLLLKHVSEPPPLSFDLRRPDAKSYAQSLGIDVNAEFRTSSIGSSTSKHTPKLQSLYYPTELERLCRRISSEARTIIEETGTNMLYLVFGFLEFCEQEDSEKTMLAPLLAVPAALEKGAVDRDTGTYRYSIIYSGEDVRENLTLREKLNQDFMFQFPEFDEEEGLGGYFEKISHAIKNKKRWTVKYQLTLGFLSFGKHAIWNDLDPKKWPGLLIHPLLNEVFSGGSGGNTDLFPEDYEIDKHFHADLPLVYDADSSQHSAIIDVLSGKNMVINGPPGTGKSQTITNIIATGLRQGKTILFISEKLAALEVVRNRLNQANLGSFCLELHSHKTQKKKLLSDLQDRLNEQFRPPQQLEDKITVLRRKKKKLNRYAELMASRVGNELGLTIHEIFWRAEKYRQVVGNNAGAVQSLFLVEAAQWSYDHIEHRRAKLEVLGNLFTIIGNFDSSHPWWGFRPRPLIPGDDETIGRIVLDALHLAKELANNVLEYQTRLGVLDEPTLANLEMYYGEIEKLPDLPPNVIEGLLSRTFNVQEKQSRRNSEIVADMIDKIKYARELTAEADKLLGSGYNCPYDEIMPIVEECAKLLTPSVLDIPLEELKTWATEVDWAVDRFRDIVSQTHYFSVPIISSNLDLLDVKLEAIASLNILDQPLRHIREGAEIVIRETGRLRQSLGKIADTTSQYEIEFDNSPGAITRLTQSKGIENILPGIQIDEIVVEESLRVAGCPFADRPITELHAYFRTLKDMHQRASMAFEELDGYARRLDFPFDGSPKSVSFLNFLSLIADKAPFELLAYRHLPLEHSITNEVLDAVEQSFKIEETQRSALALVFYLDELPSIDDLKALVRIFRRGDHFFNFLKSEWRSAKKVIKSISRNKTRKKATEYEAQISKIINWLEYQAILLANDEFKSTFGPLYGGLNTDFLKIRRLYTWYSESREEMLKHSGFIDSSFNLTEIDSVKLSTVKTLSARIKEILGEFDFCLSQVRNIISPAFTENKELLNKKDWREVNQEVLQTIESLRDAISFLSRYVSPKISPLRATQLLRGQLELLQAKDEINALCHGVEIVRQNAGSYLPGVLSIPCMYWDQYINQLFDLSCSAKTLSDFLEEYGPQDMSPREAREFFQAKITLDALYQKFGNLPSQNVATTDWNAYISEISKGTGAGSRLVKALTNVPAGKTVNQVISGMNARREATQVIDDLSKDHFVRGLFSDSFQGLETDIEAMASTLFWGETIVNNKLISASPLKQLLLSAGTNYNLRWVRDLFSRSFQVYEGIQEKLKELNGFGVIKWDIWNHFPSTQLFASSILNRIKIAADDVEAVLPWSKYIAERSDCERMGFGDFVVGLERKDLSPTSMSPIFKFVVYRSIGRSIYKNFSELEGFSGAEHEKMRMEFTALDNEIIGLTGKSFANEINKATKVPPGDVGYRASERTEMQLILHELGKQRRHLPIRQLIKRAGRAIQALKPCFMMGPMSVAQYIEQGSVEFDIIVMDEASQLRPEEALGAIARGEQLIIVGDPKQLPPTNFFDRIIDSSDDDEDEDVPATLIGSESILDICQQLFHPIRTLRWHYRSRHESLIAFSNHEFYNNKLLVFPSPFRRNSRLGLRYRFIKNGIYKGRQNIPEAQCVVDAVIGHMMKHMKDEEGSLGVVTLNITQRDLIEDLLDKKIRCIEEAQKFISKWEAKGWPFFVKNLENVQGDERDVIFISTTFGKSPGTDGVRQNFGPISRPDGWRRLNVLFTRARQKTEVFSSMLPEDIILETKTPAGTKALRGYLDFAKRGVIGAADISERDPDSDFEIAVGDMLRNRGFDIVPQLGVAGFFIDIAVRNPGRPGEFLAAIECDGVAYHSSSSARDRDRIRQAVLESLGWKDRIWRIWSTDWFYDPRGESKKLLSFLDERCAIAASEPPPEYDFYDEMKIAESDPKTEDSVGEIQEASREVFNEDFFVEVGDSVTYCFSDKATDYHIVTIVDGRSIAERHLINENAPLAKVLLGMSVGDTEKFEVHGHPSREVRVIKIQREGS